MSEDAVTIFDRRLLRQRRERAAPGFAEHDFLVREVAERLVDRLDDVRRDFPLALDLGSHGGVLAETLKGRGGIETLVQSDLSEAMARKAARAGSTCLVADEEFLPIGEARLDLVMSVMTLQWVNDLPGALLQINLALKPDCLFLGAMLGGDTLHELRVALMEAESEVEGGISPRVSPFAEVRDMGGLMQRAGFALPLVDSDTIEVTYPNVFKLMRDLRGMAQANAVRDRRRDMTRRETLLRAAAIYEERYARPDGRIPATFQVIYLTGWRPHASQPQPLRPGSAKARLAAALKTEEKPAGDIASPAPTDKDGQNGGPDTQ